MDSTDKERDARMRVLADQLPVATWSVDAQLRVTSVSGGAVTALGFKPDRVVGTSLYDIWGASDLDQTIAGHRRALAGESVRFESEWRGRGYDACVEPLRDPSGTVIGAIGMAIDVTSRDQAHAARSVLQEKLREQYRMEWIGKLASGLAHEINNPLQSILNFAQLIRARTEAPNVREYAEEIALEVRQLSDIMRNLQSLVHQEDRLPFEIRVDDLVERTLSLFRAALNKEGIELAIDVSPDLPAAWGRAHGIQQVLINLLTGARDALNARYPLPDSEKRIHVQAAVIDQNARRLRLTVRDHGAVVPPGSIAQVFEPFSGVSGRDQGSGLRLAISHGIARENAGSLTVESDAELGTRFHLDLPLASDQ